MSREDSSSSFLPERTSITGRVVVLALLYAGLVVMLRVAEGGSLSLFLGHLGADRLPYTFLAISLINIPLTFLYLKVASKVPTRVLLAMMAVVLVALLFGARAIAGTHPGVGFFAAYVTATVLNTFIVIQWGTVLLEFFTVKESMRAFPLLYTGVHVGGFIAGVLLRDLARPLGTENLMLYAPAAACVLVLALIVFAGRLKEGSGWRQGQKPQSGKAFGFSAIKKLGLLKRSRLLRAIAAATAVMVFLRLALRFSYAMGFERAFPDSDDLTRFIGTYTIIASVCSITMQVLVTPRLLKRLGVGLLNVVYSYCVGATLLLTAIVPGLPAAVMGRATDLDLKSAVKTPLSPMFYEALGEEHRTDGRAIILGIISPVASLGSSVLLVLVIPLHLEMAWIATGGTVLALLFIVLSHLQGRAYHRSLEELLVKWHKDSSGEVEVSLEDAIKGALRSEDRRINDMGREVRRRRTLQDSH